MKWRSRRRREQDLEREIRSHLESEAQERRDAGLPSDQARYATQRAFGNTTSVKEAVREVWAWTSLERFWRDLRYAGRALRKDSRFTVAAIVSLALGIGANTAIFTVVNGVLLRPLPYSDPDRLFSVQGNSLRFGSLISYPDFEDWRSQNHVFSGMAGYHDGDFTITNTDEAARLVGTVVTADLLSVLRVSPILGRGFEPRDDQPGARVAILSNNLWRTKFHGDRSIIGRTLVLNREEFTVVGVMPAGFHFPPTSGGDIWTTSAVDTGSPKVQRGYNWLSVIARLKPGVTPSQAQAGMDVVAQRLAQQYPATNARRTSVRMTPELDRVIGNSRLALNVLLGVVAGILLIACVNVANLLIARNLARHKEMSIRAALGANRGILVAQLLTESVALSIAGGICGIAFAFWSARALTVFAPQALPRAMEVAVDGRVLGFALALSIVTGLIFGLAPALRMSRTSLEAHLREARQTTSDGPRQHRLRDLLVMAQTALAVVLTLAAALLTASYLRLLRVDPGFDGRNVLTFHSTLPGPLYTADSQLAFYNELLSRLRELPNVKSAVASWPLPFAGGNPSSGFEIEGRPHLPGYMPTARIHLVSPGYFHSLGMRVQGGRDFTDRDIMKSIPVAIVDKAFVLAYFPNENPVHKRIKPGMAMSKEPPWREIVGVVNSTKELALAEDFQPQYYIPYAQLPGPQPSVIVKTEGNPLAISSAVPRVVAAIDKNVPVYGIRSMDELVASSVARERFNTFLFGLFGILAIVLAAVGIYGVANRSVSQAVREIGIRMALGAQPRDVLGLTLMNTLRSVGIGLAAGIAISFALTRFMAGLLYGVRPTDPVLLGAVCFGFAAVALCASYVPARRATKIDPMVALRYE